MSLFCSVKTLLKHLTIRDFALVARLDVNFDPGLTVVTGESGAGKSILMNALALVLGERASTSLIHPGASKAEVTAEFDLHDNSTARDLLAGQALTDEDHPQRCLCRRVVGQDGRSRAFVNGTPVNLHVLRALTEGLVDIHGQDENQRLAKRDVQLNLLDAYGVAATDRHSMAQAHRAWRQTEKQIAVRQAGSTNATDRANLLRYQLQELRTLDLAADEFESLQAEHRRLSQAQDIQAAVANAIAILSDLAPIHQANHQLAAIDDDHPGLANARETLTSALQLMDDAVHDLRGYIDGFEMDPAHLAQLSERLDSIHELARKHRISPSNLVAQAKSLEQEITELTSQRTELESLEKQAKDERDEFQRMAVSVSQQRRRAAEGFATEVSAGINVLGIQGGAFHVQFEAADSEHGLESVEFQVTANPRYPAGRLSQVASGGERARVSLAICVVAAQKAQLPCLMLDEADVGVGGATADTIGRMLRDLGTHTQVICVTHAPQVAALGDNHLVVEKDAAQEVHIRHVANDGRVEEVARMLAGANLTDKSRAYAQTLLDGA